jgi:hypothetical protein
MFTKILEYINKKQFILGIKFGIEMQKQIKK